MHRFLPGVLLIQAISLVVLWVNIGSDVLLGPDLLVKVLLPLLLLAVTTALWFDSIARNRAADMIAKLKERHARDREKLQVETQKEKSKVIKDAHKEIVREQRRVNSKANMKVGVAFFAAAGAGILMLITELVTFGMMTLMTAGGALSGYLFRGRRETTASLSEPLSDNSESSITIINQESTPPSKMPVRAPRR